MKQLLKQLKISSNEVELLKRTFYEIEKELDEYDAKEYQEYIWKAEDALFELQNEIEINN